MKSFVHGFAWILKGVGVNGLYILHVYMDVQ